MSVKSGGIHSVTSGNRLSTLGEKSTEKSAEKGEKGVDSEKAERHSDKEKEKHSHGSSPQTSQLGSSPRAPHSNPTSETGTVSTVSSPSHASSHATTKRTPFRNRTLIANASVGIGLLLMIVSASIVMGVYERKQKGPMADLTEQDAIADLITPMGWAAVYTDLNWR